MINSPQLARVSPWVFLALLICVAGSAQASVQVGTCKPNLVQFTTIQAAVNASAVGGIVYVCPGPYYEQVVITKKLQLLGVQDGPGVTPILFPPAGGLLQNGTDIFGNPVAAQIFVDNATGGNVEVLGLIVDGTGNNLAGCGGPTLEGIYYQGSSGTITDNTVRNQYQTDFTDYGGCQNGLAINVESLTAGNAVTVSANSVRAYQKNGITATGAGTGAGSPGPSVVVLNNYIVGLASNAMNWQTAGAAENGIQIGFGATGKVSDNTVLDNIWPPDTSTQPGNAASGILIFASSGITVTGNIVGSAQFGIVADTDSAGYCTNASLVVSCGPADHSIITSNRVVGTQIFDAIDACSNDNTIESNTIYGTTESAVHLDDTCTSASLSTTSGNGNTATKNIINEACAGILLGTGSGNTASPNTTYNAFYATLSGDVCSVPGPDKMAADLKPSASKQQRPSPYRPMKK